MGAIEEVSEATTSVVQPALDTEDDVAPVDPAVAQKLATATQKKDAGDAAFKSGDLITALRSYHEAILYLQGIEKNAMGAIMPPSTDENAPKKRTEADIMLEKIFANMSACHVKKANWKRAVETADKALVKNPDNYKCMFRKAKALGEQGLFEKAERIFEDLISKSTTDAAVAKTELERFRVLDKAKEKANNQRLKGFLKKGGTLGISDPNTEPPAVKSGLVEVSDDD